MTWLMLAALAGAADGELVGVVFQPDGAPVPGATVDVGGATVTTDAEGAFRVAVPEGTPTVRVTGSQGSIEIPSVPIAGDATTELLLTLGQGPSRFALESPTARETAVETPTGPPGRLTGTVTDGEGPVAGARVFVRGSDVDATTDRDGRFVLDLPSGTWDISVVRAGFTTVTGPQVVTADTDTPVAVTLERSGLLLADFTITAPKIEGGAASVLDERREASAVSDVLGAQQMSRSGDSDAAAALRRVTGLTVVGGKYVFVRGLGDRYSATLLNGSLLPSPEPEKRVVPLDLFPTAMLEAVVIQKTFSPDKPAEFGGGIVEIRTRQIPEEPFFTVSLAGAYVAGTTFEMSPVGATGKTDWLGFGAADRALPESVAAAGEGGAIKAGGIFSDTGFSPEELEPLGEAFDNRWGTSLRRLPPGFGLNTVGGRTWDLGGAKFGALGALVFNNGWSRDVGTRTVYSNTGSELEARRITDFTDIQNRIRLGGAASFGLSWSDRAHILSTTLLNRSSTATALTFDADDPTGSNDTHNERVAWEEQQLLFEQVEIAAPLGDLQVTGRYAGALATRVEPDRRDWTYLDTDDGLYLSQRGSWAEILYGQLRDTTHDAGVDLELPISEASLKAGVRGFFRERAADSRRYTYQFKGSEGIDLAAPIEQVIRPENIGAEGEDDPGYLELEENTNASDDYAASHRILATYAMADVPWTTRLRTMTGARLEQSTQSVATRELFDTTNEPVEAELSTLDVLPAATLTWGIGPSKEPDRMLVRAGYGRTLSRPELRELSEVAYYDYRTGRLLYGNPNLERATIENVDVRWEWYPRSGESISAGVFFKYFDSPIESVIAVSAVSGSVGTFANATSATNFGAELEIRQRLDRIALLLEDFTISANTSFIASRVDLSETEGNQTSSERPLQGQSPWVVNAQLAYENPDTRTNASILYNAFGPRIVDVGTSGIPDTFEMPIHRVDLVASQGIGEHFGIRATGQNLLDWPAIEKTGDLVSERTREGWAVGLGITWTD